MSIGRRPQGEVETETLVTDDAKCAYLNVGSEEWRGAEWRNYL